MSQANSIVAHKARKGQTRPNPLLKKVKKAIFGLARRGLLQEAERLTDSDRERAVDEVLSRGQQYVIEDPTGLTGHDFVSVFCARTRRLICAVSVSEVVS